MLKKIAIGIGVLIAVLVLLALTKPDTFRVERSAMVAAPAGVVYPLVNDFREWHSWSPFEKLDPDMARTFSGPESGVGAAYEWDGNSDAGSGRMEITESSPLDHITIDLLFTAPFESRNTTEFSFEPVGDSTRVTWAMHGPNQFIGKLMSVFISMDSMIGRDFEEGLASMKRVAEERSSGTDEDSTPEATSDAA